MLNTFWSWVPFPPPSLSLPQLRSLALFKVPLSSGQLASPPVLQVVILAEGGSAILELVELGHVASLAAGAGEVSAGRPCFHPTLTLNMTKAHNPLVSTSRVAPANNEKDGRVALLCPSLEGQSSWTWVSTRNLPLCSGSSTALITT